MPVHVRDGDLEEVHAGHGVQITLPAGVALQATSSPRVHLGQAVETASHRASPGISLGQNSNVAFLEYFSILVIVILIVILLV